MTELARVITKGLKCLKLHYLIKLSINIRSQLSEAILPPILNIIRRKEIKMSNCLLKVSKREKVSKGANMLEEKN
jgi:hypothetical protein